MATGTTKPALEAQLAAAHERLLGRAKKLWEHLHAGEDFPPDDVLLEAADTLEEQYEESLRAEWLEDSQAEGDRPAPVPVDPNLALLLQRMAEGQAALQESVLELARERSEATARANEPHEVALTGDAAALASALDGTSDDGGDGPNPLDEAVVFRSRGKQFRATMVPRRRFVGPDGMQYFTNGRLIDFSPQGTYTTRNPDNVAWLRARPGMNVEYWEVGKEPHSAPDPQLVIERIIEATLALDDAALEKLEQDERASHKRPAVLQSVAVARLKIQGFTQPGEEA